MKSSNFGIVSLILVEVKMIGMHLLRPLRPQWLEDCTRAISEPHGQLELSSSSLLV